MAILEVEVPEHELAFVQKQLALLGYSVIGAPKQPVTQAEKIGSPAQKTMLKAFAELRAAHTSSSQWKTTTEIVDDVKRMHEDRWGPGL